MNKVVRYGTIVTLTLALSLVLTMTASAHGGEDHTDAVSAILHQGEWGLLIAALVIGAVAAVSWRRTRNPAADQRSSSE